MSYSNNRLNRDIRLDISGYFIKNTEYNLHILNVLGVVIQKVQVQPDYFLFLSEREEKDDIYTQWTIGIHQQDADKGYYVSVSGNVTINTEKEISADSLIALVKNNLYVFSTEYFYKNLPMKKLKKEYKLKINFDWLEDTEHLSSDDKNLLEKYNRCLGLPSKEVLSAVLGVEIITFEMKQNNVLSYEYNKKSKNKFSGKEFCNRSINIYELAFKIKEYAFNKGYVIYSGIKTGSRIHIATMVQRVCGGDYLYYGTGENVLEALTNSCEWILNQQNGGVLNDTTK